MGKVWWKRLHLDPVLVACFAILFAFPIGASIVAANQPRDADPDPDLPAAATAARSGAGLRGLPAFSPRSPLERRLESASLLTNVDNMQAELSSAMRELLGGERAAVVMRVVAGSELVESADEFPYRAPRFEALLDAGLPRPLDDARANGANDLAALLVLAAAHDPDGAHRGAPFVAAALLNRARAGDRCIPQLNLAFLASLDDASPAGVVQQEFERAQKLCPTDPTATWMRGQLLSRQVSIDERQLTRSALATFRRLQRRPSGGALGLSGEADTELRLAYEREALLQPFSARAHFQRALKLYRHAQRLDRDPGLAAGAARAHAGLGEFDEAAALQRRAVAGRPTLAPVAVRYVEYLERDGRFGDASRAARPLIARHEFASGRALIRADDFGGDDGEDVGTPLSIGVDRLKPIALEVSPPLPGAGAGEDSGGVGAVTDLSFIPEFRDVDGLTGHHRWCPAWSLARDLLLDGRPDAALAALPGEDAGIANALCPSDEHVAAMAAFELGHPAEAAARLREAGLVHALSDLRDLRQNMWRFAGRSEKARAAAAVWMEREPSNSLAAERLGEIAFIAEDHATAARWFGRSLRLIRQRALGATSAEADALLNRGTALAFAGRRGEALALLERADEVATRAEAAAHASSDSTARAVLASYHARVQSGDVLLRAHRYAAASEAYEAARERESRLGDNREEVLARPEALQNNQAIAEAKLSNHDAAVQAARTALKADPQSPVFLVTSGYALRLARRFAEAERDYRAAVVAEPSSSAAWNDLGIVLGRQGLLDEAVQAFRRSLGERDHNPLAWFNLGVAQGRRGVAHALASQGAFGRAFGQDDGLRDRERNFIADDTVFFTDLDLSKPLPPRWGYTASQERAPVTAAGIGLLVLLGLRLGRTLLARSFGGSLAGRFMDPMMSLFERFKQIPQYAPAIVAVLATVAVFGAGLLRGGGGSVEAFVLVIGVLALAAIVVRGRMLFAREAGVTVGQRGWTPGIALGAVVAALGSAWAPLPVAEPSEPAPAVHWIGPVLTGLAALGLLVLGAWLGTPGTIALASVAIVMTASLLTPTKPLDGGFVASGTAGVAAGLALLGAGLFFVLGVS